MFSLVTEFSIPDIQVHAASICEYQNALHVVWFGGTKEKHPDTAIYISRCHNGIWSAPKILAKIAPEAHWNPILFVGQDNLLYCYFKVGPSCSDWQTWFIKSDDGMNWTWQRPLVWKSTEIRGPSRNKPIILSDESIIAPGSDENTYWRCYTDRSIDQGRSWIKSEDIRDNTVGLIQPALWESTPGNVHMYARSDCGWLFRADSLDYGVTWSKPYRTGIPNNNSAIDIIHLSDERLVMALNPVAINWGVRAPLSLITSIDNGNTWSYIGDIESVVLRPIITPNGIMRRPIEYSYPSLCHASSGIYCAYSCDRSMIRISIWDGSTSMAA